MDARPSAMHDSSAGAGLYGDPYGQQDPHMMGGAMVRAALSWHILWQMLARACTCLFSSWTLDQAWYPGPVGPPIVTINSCRRASRPAHLTATL